MSSFILQLTSAALQLAAAQGKDKLPPPTRAAAQMALLGILLVGVFFIVLILLGGHWVRRQGSPRRGPVVPPDRAPLREESPPRLDEHDDG
jgi:hypothetical protein